MLAAGVRPTEFTVHERSVVTDGDHSYAHLSAEYAVGSGPEAVCVPVRATEVMQRREDGTWLYVIDHA
jgi:ketosteroid isomerase-like protein